MPPIDVAAEVISNLTLSADYNVVSLAAPAIAAAAAPGQFVMVKAAAGHDPLLRRPFSVFDVMREANGAPSGISILNKRIGAATALLYAARPGQRFACLGPLGNTWLLGRSPEQAYMVAGGVGLAAFATLARSLGASGVPMTMFYGARTGAELVYLDFFRDLGVELVLTTEDGSIGERGRVVAPLERYLADPPRDAAVVVYACGPEGMMAAAAGIARRFGTPCLVSMERTMACGLGGCYSCVVPIRGADGSFDHVRSCLAGPVMAGDAIAWD